MLFSTLIFKPHMSGSMAMVLIFLVSVYAGPAASSPLPHAWLCVAHDEAPIREQRMLRVVISVWLTAWKSVSAWSPIILHDPNQILHDLPVFCWDPPFAGLSCSLLHPCVRRLLGREHMWSGRRMFGCCAIPSLGVLLEGIFYGVFVGGSFGIVMLPQSSFR